MGSESDHWQKSDQFSSISSAELNELSCEYFKLNSSLCKDSLLKELTVDNDKSDTLCNRKAERNDKLLKENENDKLQNVGNVNQKDKCSIKRFDSNAKKCLKDDAQNNGECLGENSKEIKEQSKADCKTKVDERPTKEQSFRKQEKQQSNDMVMKLDYEKTTVKDLKRDRNQLELNSDKEDSIDKKDTIAKQPKQHKTSGILKSNIKKKLNTSKGKMDRASSIGENINDLKSNLDKDEIKFTKDIKRSASETVLHFNSFNDDVNSADDELDEDDLEFEKKLTNFINSSNDLNNSLLDTLPETNSKRKTSSNLSLNNQSYCLDTYSLKKEKQSNKTEPGLDFFSSDEHSIEQNQLTKPNLLNETNDSKGSPMLDLDTEDEVSQSDSKNREFNLKELIDKIEKDQLTEPPNLTQSNDESIEPDSIEKNRLQLTNEKSLKDSYYNLYQNELDDSITNSINNQTDDSNRNENDFENQDEFLNNIQSSSEFENELFNHEQILQSRHHITSLENLFSLETIQEQDEEDYSLKDQSSLRSNITDQLNNHNNDNLIATSLSNNIESSKGKSEHETTDSNLESSEKKEVYKKVIFENDERSSSLIEEETTSTDYKKFKTFKRDSSIDDELTISNDSKSYNLSNRINDTINEDDDDNFNSLSECTIDENVTIDDQQVVVDKTVCTSEQPNLNPIPNRSITNQSKPLATRPEILKRSSLINKNIEQLNNSKKKLNNLIQHSKIEPRAKLSNSINLTRSSNSIPKIPDSSSNMSTSFENSSSYLEPPSKVSSFGNKLNPTKKELSESGVHMDHIDDNSFKRCYLNDKFKNDRKSSSEEEVENLSKKIQIKQLNSNALESGHLSSLDGSSGVDSGNSLQQDEQEEFKSIKKSSTSINWNKQSNEYDESVKFENPVLLKEKSTKEEKSDNKYQLSKSKSMYNVDQPSRQTVGLSTGYRLTNEEFNRRKSSYEINLDGLEREENSNTPSKGLGNLRKKSTNYLLNQSFKKLSNEDITRIKKELIRRSEERLAKFETSISSRSNSVHNSVIESVSYSNYSKNESLIHSINSVHNSLHKRHESDENLDSYQNKRISRKDINEKWRDTLKRNDSLDSINSIKSMNSLGSLTSDVTNLKYISRNRIKSTSFLDSNHLDNDHLSEDEYDYAVDNHYVYKDKITSEYLTQSNLNRLIHSRSREERRFGLEIERKFNKDTNVEEDNDYDELIENSYVEMSDNRLSDRSAKEHTYKVISEKYQNPYELESDSLNDIHDDENPYISIREDFLSNRLSDHNYQNLEELNNSVIRDEYLIRDKNEVRSRNCQRQTDHLIRHSSMLEKRESFNQPALPKVKLPLKRSKSVPGNTFNSKYLNGRSSISKLGHKKDDIYLQNQLEFQKQHLNHLHKQHWQYRLRNSDENEEINDYASLFTLNQDNLHRTPDLLIAYGFNKEKKVVQLFIKECRNCGNLKDKYLKIYLLPDKQKRKEGLESKTIGVINNLIERKSFNISSPIINKKFMFECEQLDDLRSRTIFISIWKNKKSLLEKNQCLGELFLKVTDDEENTELKKVEKTKSDECDEANQDNNLNIKLDLEDSISKLSFDWYTLDQTFNYSGEIVASILYDSNEKQLKVKVIGCVNLMTRKRDLRNSNLNTYVQVELKRAMNPSNSDKTTGNGFRSDDIRSNDDARNDQASIQREFKDINDNDVNHLNGKNNREDEKQVKVRFSDDIEKLESIKQSKLFSLIAVDSQKSSIIKNNSCPTYNKLFVFNDVLEAHLEQSGLEFSIWNCPTLHLSSYCLSSALIISRFNLGETSLDGCLKEEEMNSWQQVIDKSKFNSWIDIRLNLNAVD